MERIFGRAVLADLNAQADKAKGRLKGGGDPDLFVYRRDYLQERFFVEVKHHDQLTEKQEITFPLIRKLCPIVVARIKARQVV